MLDIFFVLDVVRLMYTRWILIFFFVMFRLSLLTNEDVASEEKKNRPQGQPSSRFFFWYHIIYILVQKCKIVYSIKNSNSKQSCYYLRALIQSRYNFDVKKQAWSTHTQALCLCIYKNCLAQWCMNLFVYIWG